MWPAARRWRLSLRPMQHGPARCCGGAYACPAPSWFSVSGDATTGNDGRRQLAANYFFSFSALQILKTVFRLILQGRAHV